MCYKCVSRTTSFDGSQIHQWRTAGGDSLVKADIYYTRVYTVLHVVWTAWLVQSRHNGRPRGQADRPLTETLLREIGRNAKIHKYVQALSTLR